MKPLWRIAVVLIIGAALSGCTGGGRLISNTENPPDGSSLSGVANPSETTTKPKPRPETSDGGLLDGTITAAEATNVTQAEAAAAGANTSGTAGRNLGKTIATLGSLDRDGIWMRTPLVKSEVQGRVVYLKLGKSATVTLLPLDAEPGAGSQLSLAAMQVLGISLTDLAEVQVFVQ